MIPELIFTFGPGFAGILIQVFFWQSLSQMRRGTVRTDNGRQIERITEPVLFWGYVAIWTLAFLLSLVLLFWSIAWVAYVIEYWK